MTIPFLAQDMPGCCAPTPRYRYLTGLSEAVAAIELTSGAATPEEAGACLAGATTLLWLEVFLVFELLEGDNKVAGDGDFGSCGDPKMNQSEINCTRHEMPFPGE